MKYICCCVIGCVLFACSHSSKSDAVHSEYAAEASEVVMTEDVAENKAKLKDNKTTTTWKRTSKVPNTVTLFVGDEEQLKLKGSQIAIKIDGFRARVLIDCFFYNEHQSQLEGTFKMKLPQGASPYYFAFGESVLIDKSKNTNSMPFVEQGELEFSPKKIEEIRSESWTSPKVARVVQKEKAAFAYGQTVRKRVDPALAEWAGADVFNCRVFPLMPKKLHRVVIGYDVNLTALENDYLFNFPIPKVDCPLVLDFDVADIDGVKCVISPQVEVSAQNDRQTFRLTNPKGKELSVRYSDCTNLLLKSLNDETGTAYFASSFSPDLPVISKDLISDKALIALDISLSSNPDKFNVWLKLTEALLLNNQDEIKRFNVLLFNVETFWWKDRLVDNNPENVQAFLKYASQIVLEGASDINLALSEISVRGWEKNTAENVFLLSDGSDTWGEEDSDEMVKKIDKNDRIFAFNIGMSGADITNLNHFTRSSGGALFSVTGEDELQKVSTAFRYKPWKLEEISISGGEDVLIAGRPEYLYFGQKIFVTGRGDVSKGAALKLQVSQNNIKKEIRTAVNSSIESELTTRIYGQTATEILEEFDYATEKKSVAYAKHFGVPGKTCSLLMLETEEDYKEYNIAATEDAFVVKASPVNDILDEVLKNIEEMLGSAKNKFKNWLGKLTVMDGIDFQIPASMDIVIEKIPESNFLVKQQELVCKVRLKNVLQKEFLDSLLNTRLDYDQFTKEANRRFDKYGSNDALKALSSLVEKNPGNSVLCRDVAYSALEWGLNEQAYYLFKRVLKTRPFEPQTYLAIANSLAKVENFELSLLYYEIAVTAIWDSRFGEFRRIAALDYLNLLAQLKDKKSFILSDYAQSRYQTLKAEFKEDYADLMLVISWNTDNTDIDLHVHEPGGEECFYQNRETKIGGHMTEDVTRGYGPEMYVIQDAKEGEYDVKVKYFSSDRNRTSTRTKVYATIYKNWGKKNESVSTKIVTLKGNKEMHDVVTVKLN